MKKSIIIFSIIGVFNLLFGTFLTVFGIDGITWVDKTEKLAQIEKFGFYDKNLTLLVNLEYQYWYFDLFAWLGGVVLMSTIVMLIIVFFFVWHYCGDFDL